MAKKSDKKTFEVGVKELQWLDWQTLKTYETNTLKEGERPNIDKLINAIVNKRFNFPFYLWAEHQYIVDGAGRFAALTEMEKRGYDIPKLPVCTINADNFQQAKMLVLQASSEFGKVTQESFAAFAEDLDFDDFKDEVHFPDIDFGFDDNFLPSGSDDEDIEDSEIDEFDDTYSIYPKEEIAQNAYNWYRVNGFIYPRLEVFECMQELNKLAVLPEEKCLRSNLAYSVADTFHPHRQEAAAFQMRSPVESFNDDNSLKKAIDMSLKMKTKLSSSSVPSFINLVNGTQSCSNFRPAFARYLYNKYCIEGGVVFDSSTGYGGRLTGFLASTASKYIGTDPNKPTFDGNVKLANTLGQHKVIELHNEPIEDLDISQYIGKCDFAFTSPPYFCKEIYNTDDKQSWVRYSTYEDWLEGFLKIMVKKNYDVLRSGTICIINIEDVNIKGIKYKLVEPTIEFGKSVGFDFVKIEQFKLQNRTRIVDGEVESLEAFESVIIFKKK